MFHRRTVVSGLPPPGTPGGAPRRKPPGGSEPTSPPLAAARPAPPGPRTSPARPAPEARAGGGERSRSQRCSAAPSTHGHSSTSQFRIGRPRLLHLAPPPRSGLSRVPGGNLQVGRPSAGGRLPRYDSGDARPRARRRPGSSRLRAPRLGFLRPPAAAAQPGGAPPPPLGLPPGPAHLFSRSPRPLPSRPLPLSSASRELKSHSGIKQGVPQ